MTPEHSEPNKNESLPQPDAEFAQWLSTQFARIRSQGNAIPPSDDPLDRTHFVLSDEDFDRFVDMIENPPDPPQGLRRLLAKKPRWG